LRPGRYWRRWYRRLFQQGNRNFTILVMYGCDMLGRLLNTCKDQHRQHDHRRHGRDFVAQAIMQWQIHHHGLRVAIDMESKLPCFNWSMKSDTLWAKSAVLPTQGKEMPDTPNWLSGLNLKYNGGNWYVFGEAKYTGKRYTTLVNDDSLGGYTLFNAGAGYTMQSTSWVKNPTLRLNVYNLFDKSYLSMSSSSGSLLTSNAVDLPGIKASTPSFYVGGPRSLTVSLAADF